MKIIRRHLKGYGWQIFASFVLISIMVLAQMMQPNLLKDIINEIALGNTENIAKLGIEIIVIAFVGLFAGVANTFFAAKISQKAGYSLRAEIFHTIQQFSFQNIEKFSTGNLVVRLTNDVQQVQNLIMMLLQVLTRLPLMFVFSFIMALVVMPQLWWIIILFVVLIVITTLVTFLNLGPRFAKAQRFLEKVNTIAKENFLGIRVVKSFVQEDEQIATFTTASDDLANETLRIGYIFSIMMPIVMIISDTATTLTLYLVGSMVEADPTVVSSVVAFTSYLMRIGMAIVIGSSMLNFASRAIVSLRRISEVLDTKSDLHFGTKEAKGVKGSIEFRHVSFQYAGAQDKALKDVSFQVNPGKMIGIIGATGAGKTTLAQLIARIYNPQEGEILIGGEKVDAFSPSAFRRLVAIVLQRPILFSGTIADNIRQGKEDATDEEMLDAAQIAQAAEFIEALPERFNARVYQRGANFSGGQKQRISITRGLVAKPKILILDDSTSALDAKSEKRVKEGIAEKLKGTTKIIISQKISSIVQADKILVLHEGKLVGSGTHKELVKNNAIYREIYDTQKGAQS